MVKVKDVMRILYGDLGKSVRSTLIILVNLLNNHNIDYTVIGGVAVTSAGYSKYTDDVDVMINQDDRVKVIKLLIDNGFQLIVSKTSHDKVVDPETEVEVDIMSPTNTPELEALRNKARIIKEVDDQPMKIVKPEYLVWMYLLSDQIRHKTNAIELIKRKLVNLEKLRQLISHELIERLQRWEDRAQEELKSPRNH